MFLKCIGNINDAMKPADFRVAVLQSSNAEQIPKLQSPERGFCQHPRLISSMNIKKLLRMSNECKYTKKSDFYFFIF